jgi:hypothetical protein
VKAISGRDRTPGGRRLSYEKPIADDPLLGRVFANPSRDHRQADGRRVHIGAGRWALATLHAGELLVRLLWS